MSNATPMSSDRREAVYLRQSGRTHLTPRQRRRLDKKVGESLRGHARPGRLRRRYDRKDTAEVKAWASSMSSIVRKLRGF